MAYMDQTKKAKIAPVVKALLKKHGVKGSLSVRNHSALVLTIKQGSVDFIANFNDTVKKMQDWGGHVAKTSIDVNPYHFQNHFTGAALECLTDVHQAMMDGNHNRSDIQSDYHDVGWYIDINIGTWDKPYALVK